MLTLKNAGRYTKENKVLLGWWNLGDMVDRSCANQGNNKEALNPSTGD
jgi:hypothetical protein